LTLCDYEGHDYRTRFWEQGREYEDRAERIALRRLLPAEGVRLLEIGAGFGRLADLYGGFQQVILLDPARSLLVEAQQRLGRGGRFLYVRALADNLPLVDCACDTVVMVRVMHHLADVPRCLREVARTLAPRGLFVCEYANKRHLKSIVRFLLRRQAWSPFDRQPVEFAPLHFDFHPAWMAQRLEETGLAVERYLAVSALRLPLLKRLLAARWLAAIDGLVQPIGRCCKLSPSIFLRAHPIGRPEGPLPQSAFRCPICHEADLQERRRFFVFDAVAVGPFTTASSTLSMRRRRLNGRIVCWMSASHPSAISHCSGPPGRGAFWR
jgi:ubiquinone/menaquinone biosynthesis C-methylase UbiE